jgi:hypothetical protein
MQLQLLINGEPGGYHNALVLKGDQVQCSETINDLLTILESVLRLANARGITRVSVIDHSRKLLKTANELELPLSTLRAYAQTIERQERRKR